MSMTDTPRRGRPPMQAAPIQNASAPVIQDSPRKAARKPFGAMNLKLAYSQREGFHRHWFNDTAGRVGQAQEAGYEHVIANGKPVSKVVGTAEGGGPLHALLMEIPEEWYNEDMAQQQAIIKEKEDSLKRGVSEGKEGEGQYVPKQGITISR